MSSLESTVFVGFFVIAAQLVLINEKFKELKAIGEGIRSDLKEIQGKFKDIREEIGCEYENTPSGMQVTRWGLKHIGEGIHSDLKEIQEEIRSK